MKPQESSAKINPAFDLKFNSLLREALEDLLMYEKGHFRAPLPAPQHLK